MKQTVVIKVSMDGHKSIFGELDGQKARSKALKIAVGLPGVVSASIKGQDRDQIEVKGDGIDPVKLARLLRKNLGTADIITVAEDGQKKEGEEKKEDGEKKNEPTVLHYNMVWPYGAGDVPSYFHSNPGYPFYEVVLQEPYPACSIM